MADAQLYGPNAGGHHVTNVLLHTVSAVLLFLILQEMTGVHWCSAFVAAVFAIHPLRAESVAWVAERKDALSGVFFMLTLGAYQRYARGVYPARWWYAAALGSFACGLLAKPSLVTLPFVLLLLDYWPLGRLAVEAKPRLILEKLPFLALSAASCVATVLAQTHAMVPIGSLPFAARCANAVCGYAIYLWEMIYPVDLAVLYPLRIPPWWLVAPSAALLVTLSAAVFFGRRKYPWLAVGWLWFVGMLVPMIGLLQVGSQAHADRYTYLSQIGLYVAVTWTLAAWAETRQIGRDAVGVAGAAVLLTLAICAHRQVGYWRNSETLWRHTLTCTTDNYIAHNLLAVALGQQDRQDEAFAEFTTSLHIHPKDPGTHFYLGLYLAKHGQTDEAIRHLRLSLRLFPQSPGAEANLGLALASQGRTTEARFHYRKALEYDPDFVEAQNDLAWTLATDGDAARRDGDEALSLAQRACDATNHKVPTYLDTLAAANAEAGRFPEAVRWAETALALAEKDPALKKEVAARLASYQQGKPWHEAGPDAVLAAPL